MAFVARTREQIRAALLSALSSRFSAAGKTLSIEPGSHAYFLADALSVELMQTEAAAESLTHEILPDEAVELLDRHATVHGLTRRAPIAAALRVIVTGTPSVTISITLPARLSSPSGLVYDCTSTSVVIDGLGTGQIECAAQQAGSAGSLAAGTVMTWQSAPSGLDPTGEVFEVVTAGEDQESDDALRARILARIRQRPGSGNASDWQDWCESVDGIEEAYVYPVLQPGTETGDTLGCVTVVVLGPPQGSSASNTRLVSNDKVSETIDYINGLRDTTGALVTDGIQLRPAAIADADWTVQRPSLTNVGVEIEITNTARYPFSWSTGPLTVDGASTASSLIVSGDQTALTGKIALVRTDNVRGAWETTELKSGVFAAGKTTFTVSLSAAPVGGADAYPAPANWEALKTAVFTLFDSFGPRDTATARRWPTEDVRGRSKLYLSQLVSAALGVEGVVTASVTTPGTDTDASDIKGLLYLESFLVTEA